MAIDERARHAVHERLADLLGPERAGDLMSMVAPHGWDDVATRHDVELSREATRADLAQLREELRGEMSGLREELRGEMSGLREELRGEMSGLREELHTELRRLDHRIDTSRYSLLAWTVGTIAALNSSLVMMVVALT